MSVTVGDLWASGEIEAIGKTLKRAEHWWKNEGVSSQTRVLQDTPTSDTAPPTVDKILDERGKRYGAFASHAKVSQILKSVIADELDSRGKNLAADQQEALDMICHKIGRIINGDPDYDDSWVDIAGYAQLVVDRLRGKPR